MLSGLTGSVGVGSTEGPGGEVGVGGWTFYTMCSGNVKELVGEGGGLVLVNMTGNKHHGIVFQHDCLSLCSFIHSHGISLGRRSELCTNNSHDCPDLLDFTGNGQLFFIYTTTSISYLRLLTYFSTEVINTAYEHTRDYVGSNKYKISNICIFKFFKHSPLT